MASFALHRFKFADFPSMLFSPAALLVDSR
jgi:hypothetical protein